MVILLRFLPRKAEAESAVRQFTAEGAGIAHLPGATVLHAT